MNNRYTQALFRLRSAIPTIANRYHKKTIFFYLDALKCFVLLGVTPNEYLGWRFYELSNLERKRFYTARNSSIWEKKFNDSAYAKFFNQKELTNKAFSKFIHRNWIYTDNSTTDEIQRFMIEHNKVIIKPTNLSSGKGIHVATNEDVQQLATSHSLLEEYINQHPKLSKLNDSSVNSIRVYTLTVNSLTPYLTDDVELIGNTLFISASIRVGGVGAEVDNYHSGGVGYPIDIHKGCVSGPGVLINGQLVLYHPGTSKNVIGYEVPNWERLKQFVVELNSVFPKARLIAWDIAVLNDGFELIEANYQGDPGFMQAPTQTGKKNIIIKNF